MDEHAIRKHALAAVSEQLRQNDLAAALLFDPLNVRYVTGTASCVVFMLHSPERFVLVPVESEPVLWEYAPALGLLGWTGELRVAPEWHAFGSGSLTHEHAKAFAADIVSALDERGIRKERLGVDRLDTAGHSALLATGIPVADAQLPLELARSIKCKAEVDALRASARICDAAIERLREVLEPGVTENALWGAFMGRGIELGAEYAEARLLASGPRTNPWFQEASARVVEQGDLVAFDTDLVGPEGYLTDVSRTYLCGDGRPSDEQRRLYAAAYEFVHEALPLFRPGASFEELGSALSSRFPREFHARRYPFIAHGVGLADEYPAVRFDRHHPGIVEENMVLSIEAYVGAEDGREGVKLEEQILVTPEGYELFSQALHEERLVP